MKFGWIFTLTILMASRTHAAPTSSPLSILRAAPKTRLTIPDTTPNVTKVQPDSTVMPSVKATKTPEATPQPTPTPTPAVTPAPTESPKPAPTSEPAPSPVPRSAYELEQKQTPTPAQAPDEAMPAQPEPTEAPEVYPRVERQERRVTPTPGILRRTVGRLNPFRRRESDQQELPPAPSGTISVREDDAPALNPAPELPGEAPLTVRPSRTPASAEPTAAATPFFRNEVPAATPETAEPAQRPTATSTPASAGNNGAAGGTSLEDSDLKLPNPKAEENPVLLNAFTAAVRTGRDGKLADAAQQFKEYADNHPLSGLAPRALFLAAILEPDENRSRLAGDQLKRLHTANRYVGELQRRRPSALEPPLTPTIIPGIAATLTPTPVRTPDVMDIIVPARQTPVPIPTSTPVPTPTATPSLVRVEDSTPRPAAAANGTSTPVATEADLNRVLGTPLEPGTRIAVARSLVQQGQPDRAIAVIQPAAAQVAGSSAEIDVMTVQAEAQIAARKPAEASRTLATLVEKYPHAATFPRVRLHFGLLSEESGVYNRARNYYNAILSDNPTSPEAKVARERLVDIKGL